MVDPKEYLDRNRDRWNELVPHHVSNSSYNVEGFRSGKSMLNHIERNLLGDLTGKKVLHLQCHFGLDTLSLLYEGAREVVGIDFSAEAIKAATELANDLDLNARFVQSDIMELDQVFNEFGSFDTVFTSYGTIVWLPDIAKWGTIINKYLKPGGSFIFVDAHPFSNIFDDETSEAKLIPKYRYFHSEVPDYYKVEGSYATSASLENNDEYIWVHTISDIVTALTQPGLIIETVQELPTINWQMFPFLEKGENGWYTFPESYSGPIIPLLFALRARKPYNVV